MMMFDRRQFIVSGSAGLLLSAPLVAAADTTALFDKLWKNHPLGDKKNVGNRHPCTPMLEKSCTYDGNTIDDQCAVRFGMALRASFGDKTYTHLPKIKRETGVIDRPRTCRDLGKASGGSGKCNWHEENECHLINAYECSLALTALVSVDSANQSTFFPGIGKPRRFRTTKEKTAFRNELKDVNGIIYLHRYWRDPKKPHAGGSHIDLWSGSLQRTKLELFRGKKESKFENVSEEIVFWQV